MADIIPPDTIYLHITRKCNLSCIYCYFFDENTTNELSTNQLCEVLEDIIKINPRQVILTGGEPLMHRDFFKISKFFKEKKGDIKFSVNSNGVLINEENAKFLVETFDEIRISIDGFKEINDKLRGEGTFNKAMGAFSKILNSKGDPVALITVTSANINSLKEFSKYLLYNGVFNIHYNPVRLYGKAKSEDILHNNKEMEDLKDFWSEQLYLKHDQTFENSNCGVGKYLTINPDGSVYPCHLLSYPEFKLGNVREDNLRSIFEEHEIIKKFKNIDFIHLAKKTNCFNILLKDKGCLGVYVRNKDFKEKLKNYIN